MRVQPASRRGANTHVQVLAVARLVITAVGRARAVHRIAGRHGSFAAHALVSKSLQLSLVVMQKSAVRAATQ